MEGDKGLLEEWIHEVSGPGWVWYVKRLSGNDTLLTGGHQAGPYIPKQVVFDVFRSLEKSDELNPRIQFPVYLDSDTLSEQIVTAIWYNNKVISDGTRNECRITNWGGSSSPLLDPESTGSLCVFAFKLSKQGDAKVCRTWLCKTVAEEDAMEDYIGSVEPGYWVYLSRDKYRILAASEPGMDPCVMDSESVIASWSENFPTGSEIIDKVISLIPDVRKELPDKRLILRRNCEFKLFKSLEQHFVSPHVQSGFESIEEFVNYANSILNRRKSRSGRSLELHAKAIFQEEKLTSFAHDRCSEGRKRPDFIFPSDTAYQDESYPAEKLRILATKTTCKDRWRQVTREADRVDIKHLLTLQAGVSLNQFQEMEEAGIQLVVPAPLHTEYHESIRDKLIKLEDFIKEVRSLYE